MLQRGCRTHHPGKTLMTAACPSPLVPCVSNRRGGPGTPRRLAPSLRPRPQPLFTARRGSTASPAHLQQRSPTPPAGPLSAAGSRRLAPAVRPSLRCPGRARRVWSSPPSRERRRPRVPPIRMLTGHRKVAGISISRSVFREHHRHIRRVGVRVPTGKKPRTLAPAAHRLTRGAGHGTVPLACRAAVVGGCARAGLVRALRKRACSLPAPHGPGTAPSGYVNFLVAG